MWRSSLISLSVRLASILLSNALAIFLIATCSPVSELSAELPSQSKNPNPKTKSDAAANGLGDGERGGANEPDDAVGALADGEDGGLVLGGDLEHVPEDVVLDEPPAMAQRRLDVLHHPRPRPRRRRSRSRRLLPAAAAGLRHLRVRRLRPGVHGRIRIWIATRRWRWRKGREGKVEAEFVARFGRFRPRFVALASFFLCVCVLACVFSWAVEVGVVAHRGIKWLARGATGTRRGPFWGGWVFEEAVWGGRVAKWRCCADPND